VHCKLLVLRAGSNRRTRSSSERRVSTAAPGNAESGTARPRPAESPAAARQTVRPSPTAASAEPPLRVIRPRCLCDRTEQASAAERRPQDIDALATFVWATGLCGDDNTVTVPDHVEVEAIIEHTRSGTRRCHGCRCRLFTGTGFPIRYRIARDPPRYRRDGQCRWQRIPGRPRRIEYRAKLPYAAPVD
jgi:hypothetical protein